MCEEGGHSGALCSQEERPFLRAQLGHGHRGQTPEGLMNTNSPSLAQEVPELQTVGVCEIFWIIPQVCAFLLFFPGSQLWRQLVWPSGGVTLFSGDSKQGLDFFCWISFAGFHLLEMAHAFSADGAS